MSTQPRFLRAIALLLSPILSSASALAQTPDEIIAAAKERLKKIEDARSQPSGWGADSEPAPPKRAPAARTEPDSAPASAWGAAADPAPAEKPKPAPKPKRKPARSSRGPASVRVQSPPLHSGPQQRPPFPEKKEEGKEAAPESPFSLALNYKGELNRGLSGGIRQKTEYLGVLDLRAGADLEKLGVWKGGKVFADLLGTHGGDPSKNVGDIQVTSNLDAPANTMKLYEAWVSQSLFENKVSLLAGFHDLNTEFYVTETSGVFLNSSFGVGKDLSQSGANGPSIFPTTSPALRLRLDPSPSFYTEVGYFSARAGDPTDPYGTHARLDARDGAVLIAEAGYVRGRGDGNKLYGKYAVGVWNYTRTFDHQTETLTNASGDSVPVQATSHGMYLLTEQSINDAFGVFVRYGVASSEVNKISSALGAGVVATGLVPGRDKDRLGLGFARVTFGDEYKAAQLAAGTALKDAETAFETTYRVELLPWVAVQPDFQYVISPSGAPSIRNAWVGAIRFEINLSNQAN